MSYLVLSATGAGRLFDRRKLRDAATTLPRFGGDVEVRDVDRGGYDLLVWVRPAGGGDFQILRDVEGQSLSTDATLEQVAAVAAWAARAADFPDEGQVWLIDQDYTQHVVLHPDISAEQVADSWRPIT